MASSSSAICCLDGFGKNPCTDVKKLTDAARAKINEGLAAGDPKRQLADTAKFACKNHKLWLQREAGLSKQKRAANTSGGWLKQWGPKVEKTMVLLGATGNGGGGAAQATMAATPAQAARPAAKSNKNKNKKNKTRKSNKRGPTRTKPNTFRGKRVSKIKPLSGRKSPSRGESKPGVRAVHRRRNGAAGAARKPAAISLPATQQLLPGRPQAQQRDISMSPVARTREAARAPLGIPSPKRQRDGPTPEAAAGCAAASAPEWEPANKRQRRTPTSTGRTSTGLVLSPLPTPNSPMAPVGSPVGGRVDDVLVEAADASPATPDASPATPDAATSVPAFLGPSINEAVLEDHTASSDPPTSATSFVSPGSASAGSAAHDDDGVAPPFADGLAPLGGGSFGAFAQHRQLQQATSWMASRLSPLSTDVDLPGLHFPGLSPLDFFDRDTDDLDPRAPAWVRARFT